MPNVVIVNIAADR